MRDKDHEESLVNKDQIKPSERHFAPRQKPPRHDLRNQIYVNDEDLKNPNTEDPDMVPSLYVKKRSEISKRSVDIHKTIELFLRNRNIE